jgi:hypothetical protein
MLPELREAGTIHIDAFHSIEPTRPATQPTRADNDQLSSPYIGLTIQDEIAAQRRILRYWRMKGLDVTLESAGDYLIPDPFIGLVPMVWWYWPDHLRIFDWLHKPAEFVGLPPRLYVGTPMHAEEEIMRDPEHLGHLAQQFCENVVPWYYANNAAPKEAQFNWTPHERGVFVPALWRPSTIVACSPTAVDPTFRSDSHWRLPKSWGKVEAVTLSRLTSDGLVRVARLPVRDGIVDLIVKSGDIFAIEK